MTEKRIAEIFEQVGLAKIARELNNDELTNALQGAMIEIADDQELPEGLDEAAELEPAIDEYLRIVKEPSLRQIARYFAQWGAVWMAGQGVSVDSDVCKLANSAWVTPVDEKKFMQDVFDNFVSGDKVVVQIRKKQ